MIDIPPPDQEPLPEPPAYGWYVDPDQVTGAETKMIERYIGGNRNQFPERWAFGVAVVLARRTDPSAYPMSLIDRLTPNDVTMATSDPTRQTRS